MHILSFVNPRHVQLVLPAVWRKFSCDENQKQQTKYLNWQTGIFLIQDTTGDFQQIWTLYNLNKSIKMMNICTSTWSMLKSTAMSLLDKEGQSWRRLKQTHVWDQVFPNDFDKDSIFYLQYDKITCYVTVQETISIWQKVKPNALRDSSISETKIFDKTALQSGKENFS